MQTYEILKDLRLDARLTQKELSQQLGIGQSTIVGYEKNEREATASNLLKYAVFFNVSVDYLLGRTDDLGSIVTLPSSQFLSYDEEKLLSGFRKLSKSTQTMILRVLDNAVQAEKHG